MAKNKVFKLADQVGKLVTDFRPMVDFSGTIPEPSEERLNAFRVGMSKLAAENSFDGDPNDLVAITEFMAEMDEDALMEQAMTTAQLHAELCSNFPTADQIMALDPRYRQVFYGWLAGELNPPAEASSPGGRS